MTRIHKRLPHVLKARSLALAAALALSALTLQAQPAQAPAHRGSPPSAEQRAAHLAERLQSLKTQIGIRADQEPAWATFSGVMTTRPDIQRPSRAELETMNTLQRIDRMRELRNQRNAAMDQRAEAVRTLYGILTAEQQKAFDALSLRHFLGRPGHHGAGRGRGPAN